MQINPINTNPTNFKGQMIFKDAKQCVQIGKEAKTICLLSIQSENISSIDGMRELGKRAKLRIKTKFESIAPNLRKRYAANLNEYKTVIRTYAGDTYLVKNAPETIAAAKIKLDGSSKFLEV